MNGRKITEQIRYLVRTQTKVPERRRRKMNPFVDFTTRIITFNLEWCFSSFTRLLNQNKKKEREEEAERKKQTNETWIAEYDVSMAKIWYSFLSCIVMWDVEDIGYRIRDTDEKKRKQKALNCESNDMSLLKCAIHAIICTCYILLLPQYTQTQQTEQTKNNRNREKCVVQSLLPGFLAVRCSHNMYVVCNTRTPNRSVQSSLYWGSWMVCPMPVLFIIY